MALVSFTILDAADQQFVVVLNGRQATMRLRYNPTTERWSFDLRMDNGRAVHGRRIVTGVNLLEPFDLGIGLMFCSSGQAEERVAPDRSALIDGRVKLYHLSPRDADEFLAEQQALLEASA